MERWANLQTRIAVDVLVVACRMDNPWAENMEKFHFEFFNFKINSYTSAWSYFGQHRGRAATLDRDELRKAILDSQLHAPPADHTFCFHIHGNCVYEMYVGTHKYLTFSAFNFKVFLYASFFPGSLTVVWVGGWWERNGAEWRGSPSVYTQFFSTR